MKNLASVARKFSILMIGVLFVLAGVNHFVQPAFYTRIMPPYLPAHLTLVYVSGFFEILAGLGIFARQMRRAAGWGLIALLVAVFPANLHMALNADQFASLPFWALVARLPLQFALIAWVWWTACSRPRTITR